MVVVVVAAADVICSSVVTAGPTVRSQLALADGVSLAHLPMHVLELLFGCIAVQPCTLVALTMGCPPLYPSRRTMYRTKMTRTYILKLLLEVPSDLVYEHSQTTLYDRRVCL